METIKDLIFSLFNSIRDLFSFIAPILFKEKFYITIFLLVFWVFYRFAIANILYVKRKDKRDWFLFGFLEIFTIITYFIQVPNIWGTVLGITLIVVGLYTFFADQTRTVRSVIYSSNIVYEDNSNKFAQNKEESDFEKFRKRQDSKIHRSWSFSRTHMRYGIPVLMMRYTFKQSAMATEEQLAKAVAYLNRYYTDYNWRHQLTKNGMRHEFTAEVKTKKNLVVRFDKSISDQLDWYVVPIGAVDLSSKKTAKETPYVWMLHDPKTEGKTFPCLKRAKLPPKGYPHAFVIGATGGGKSVLVNTIIAHFVNRAKLDRQTELYLCDAKRVEFKPYESLKEVKQVAVTLDDAVKLTDSFCKEMHQRNEMMEKEGIKNIPLDGHIKLNRTININGHLIYGSDIIEFKTKDGKVHKDRAIYLDGRDDVIEVNIPEPKEEKPQEEKKHPFAW